MNDEFVELYNNTDSALTLCTADGSSGWAVARSDGAVMFVVPTGTIIPARGHYLATGSTYSLSFHAASDVSYNSDTPDNMGIALFNTATPANFSTANRFDAAGFTSDSTLYREGAGMTAIGVGNIEYTLRRNLETGTPADTNNNSADFQFLATDASLGSILGAPGPENLTSPIQRNAHIPGFLLDTTVGSSLPPNRVRDFTAGPPSTSTLGTLSLRRRFVNNTGGPVTRLRFRITRMTTFPPPGGTADLRAITSTAVVTMNINDAGTCAASGTPATPPCTVTVQGTTLEEPPAQPSGGGYNATLSVGLPQPLASAASVSVQFLLGVQQSGSFNFFINVEASSDSASPRLEPTNQTGGDGEDPLSRNFNWSVPLVNLPGRAGLNLGLSLTYNSLVWTKSNSSISFDDDRGFPSPGFRLGFPVIQPLYFNPQVGKFAYLLITPNGDRVELRQVGSSTLFEAADSSYLVLDTTANPFTLKTTDGTQLSYVWKGIDYQCTKIMDRNGNFITINYTEFGKIDTVIETLSRTIKFNYDPTTDHLITITQTWTVNGQQEPHTWATFDYLNPNLTIDTNFPGLTVNGPPDGSTIKVLSRVTLSDNSHFDFSYTSWGQVWKVSQYADGTPDDHLLNYRSYNLPLNASTTLSDCPRFTERRDWARYWNGDMNGVAASNEETITSFTAPVAASWTMPDGTPQTGTLAQVTAADTTAQKTTQKIYFAGTAGTSSGWQRRLPRLVETYDSANTLQRQSATTWEQDVNVPYPLNPRVMETNVYDPASNRARTTVTYQNVSLPDGTSCKLPQDFYEYQANATTVIRRTHTNYNLTSDYTTRRIIGLVSEKTLYEAHPVTQAETLRSKVSVEYDQTAVGTDAPVQHDNTSYGTAFVVGRGNLTSVNRYDVVTSEFVPSTMTYNTAGSVVQTTDASGHSITLSYGDAFAQNGTNLDPALSFTTLAYPTMATDADGYRSSTRYNYDFGAATWRRTPLANSTNNLPGPTEVCPSGVVCPEQKFSYDDKGRIERTTNLVNNAYTQFKYGPNYVESFTTVNNVANEARSLQVFDGAGRVIAQASNHPGSTGGSSGVRIYYDVLGRAISQSNPTETSVSSTSGTPIPIQPYEWQAMGDDATAGWVYTLQSYDWKGRPLVTTNTDSSTKEASYAGCGCAGGEVVTLAGEIVLLPPQSGGGLLTPDRRRQKVYADVLGRAVKSESLNRDGTPYMTTVTEYNARDQVTAVKEYKGAATLDGTCPVGTCQVTTTEYDGHGRLQTQHVPEQNSGTITTWQYNSDDTILKVTDARGASKTYSRNARHLVNGITYAWPGGGTVPSPATFTYDAAGNRTSMTDGTGSVAYHYDDLSRMDWEERTFVGLTGSTYRLTYGSYNLAGQLTSFTEPSQFGSSVSYGYDVAGRLLSVTGSAFPNGVASNPKYRASGALQELSYGNGLKLSNSFNSRLQLTNYQVKMPGTPVGQGERARSDYEYEADGRIKQAFDRTDQGFDRIYIYDHVGRLLIAQTYLGAYSQSFGYDEFSNMTGRANGSWRYHDDTFMQYLNNRNTSTTIHPPGAQPQTSFWVYDANGNVTNDHNKQYSYDAENNKRLVFENTATRSLWLYQDYDADGERVKRVEQVLPGGGTLATGTSYYLRSSVFDSVVIELDQNGQKLESYVHANGRVIAQQRANLVTWVHVDPVTGSLRWSATNGDLDGRKEFDPLGNDTPVTDPAPPDDPTPDYLYIGTYGNSGNTYDGASGCSIDGQPMDCSFAVRLVSMGAAAPCPDNRCGPRHNGKGWEFWNASTGWSPSGPQSGGTRGSGLPKLKPKGGSKTRARQVSQAKRPRRAVGKDKEGDQETPLSSTSGAIVARIALRPLSREGVSLIVDKTLDFLDGNRACEEALNALLTGLSESTNVAPASGTIRGVLEEFRKSGQLFPIGSTAGAAGGSLGNRNAEVVLGWVNYGNPDRYGARTLGDYFYQAFTHEVIHGAEGPGPQNAFTDEAIYNVFAAQGTFAMSVPEYENRFGKDPFAYSKFAGRALEYYCLGYKSPLIK